MILESWRLTSKFGHNSPQSFHIKRLATQESFELLPTLCSFIFYVLVSQCSNFEETSVRRWSELEFCGNRPSNYRRDCSHVVHNKGINHSTPELQPNSRYTAQRKVFSYYNASSFRLPKFIIGLALGSTNMPAYLHRLAFDIQSNTAQPCSNVWSLPLPPRGSLLQRAVIWPCCPCSREHSLLEHRTEITGHWRKS
ncbi:hypothetical protein FB446DRAFT_218815 [Lentinula raphanica]|nr:hypothetical protein FB446DRAFT_218815 [Lentinula raphanica]